MKNYFLFSFISILLHVLYIQKPPARKVYFSSQSTSCSRLCMTPDSCTCFVVVASCLSRVSRYHVFLEGSASLPGSRPNLKLHDLVSLAGHGRKESALQYFHPWKVWRARLVVWFTSSNEIPKLHYGTIALMLASGFCILYDSPKLPMVYIYRWCSIPLSYIIRLHAFRLVTANNILRGWMHLAVSTMVWSPSVGLKPVVKGSNGPISSWYIQRSTQYKNQASQTAKFYTKLTSKH